MGNYGYLQRSTPVYDFERVANENSTSGYAVDTGPGVLYRVVINNDSAGTITLQDSLPGDSGTVIATLEVDESRTYDFGVPYYIGLNVITSASLQATIMYKSE